ncbi:MAG: hypothetical protein WAK29_07765 [Terriglobales bacterium]
MKKKERESRERFEGFVLQVTLPTRNYTKMSLRRLLREGQRMYSGLEAIWRAELNLPNPDWQILESVSRQMKILEQGCPEVCEP